MRLVELVTNPATGRLSASDCAIVGAFLATTAVLVWRGLSAAPLDDWLFLGYLAAWVTHSQASKFQAFRRPSTPDKGPLNGDE
ncbi:hypothetical protein C2W27_14460 [Salmonella enterica]|nr:hypothetical protein [Salmonella enterica]